MIPITPTDKWFKTLNSLTTQFYWKNKKPRISLSTLQNKKSHGGLEAPNFHHYFLANQLKYIVKWINIHKHNYPWLELEQNQCTNISVADLPFLSQSIKESKLCQHITIHSTLTAWWKTNQITKSSLELNRFTPLWHNPEFMIQNKPLYFPTWAQKGITHLHHLFENQHFMSFNTLTQKYGVGREQFLQYQQLRLQIKDKTTLTNNTLQPSQLIEEILKINNLKKLTSQLYTLILTKTQ